MEKDVKKLIVRTVFVGIEIDGVEQLLTHYHITKPQDLFKTLVSMELKNIGTLAIKYKSKRVPRETDEPKPLSAEEMTARLMRLDDKH